MAENVVQLQVAFLPLPEQKVTTAEAAHRPSIVLLAQAPSSAPTRRAMFLEERRTAGPARARYAGSGLHLPSPTYTVETVMYLEESAR